MYYELGQEMRMRISFAFLSGFWGAISLFGFTMGAYPLAIAILVLALALLWLATNNKLYHRDSR